MSGATVRCQFRAPRRADALTPVGDTTAAGTDPVSRVARMLALAHHVERLVDAGEIESYTAVARALGVTRARMTQVMRLLQLAPEVQEQVLLGGLDWTERRLRRVVREASWPRQLAICGRTDTKSS